MKTLLITALASLALGGAPEDSVVAIKGARVIPVSGPELETATILIRGGRIDAVGKDLEIPFDAR
ncbi:MAG TPA: amidohydrolase, partial [Planctomycetota bacterium]|nr:amidohydrolase [Planctomycetota bacterium]